MGSDLHMSPPSPDEYRIVRAGSVTAVYYRHTDNIHSGGTQTWFRKHYIDDPTGAAFNTLQATQPGWEITTLEEGAVIPEQAPLDYLESVDRNWDAEEDDLTNKLIRAKERLNSAHEDFILADAALYRFSEERKAAGK